MIDPDRRILSTGQKSCHDVEGRRISCSGSGQDGALRRGRPWPQPRFFVQEQTVLNRLTGRSWLRKASLAEFPYNWYEALEIIAELNAKGYVGYQDWRLPNLNELESLVDYRHARPALPANHPFGEVPEALWSSTTSLYEPDWAWALYLQKGACGVGQKAWPHYHAWFVRDA